MENPEGGSPPPPPDLLGSRASPLAAAGALRSGLLAAVGAPRSAPFAGAGAPRSAPQHAAAAPSSSAAGALRPAAGAFVAAGASSSSSAAAPLFAAPDLGSDQADPSDFPPLIPQVPPPAAVGGPLAAGRPQLNLQAAALGGAGQGPQQAQPAAPPFVAAADLGDGNAGPSSSGGLGAGQGPQQVRPAAGRGVGTRQGPPTFAQLFASPLSQVEIPVCVHPPAATDQGAPAAFFSNEEVQASVNPLDLAIMAKTPQGRPPFPLIRAHLAQRFDFQQDFLIAPYDGRHLLIKLGCKDDYLKMLLKASISVQGKPFWFSKWTMEFSPEADSPLVPVWLELPRLPANFYFQPMLRSIAGSIGSILQIAPWTLNMTRVHAAAVCVQLDVSQPLPECVWVGIGGGGFWQPIIYPNPPRFCSECLRLGHLAHDCRNGVPPSDPHVHSKGTVRNGVPPSDPHGDSKGTVRGNDQDRNIPAPNVTWRPKPAAAKPARLNVQGQDGARKTLEKMPHLELPTESRGSAATPQARAVYLTPMKSPPQKSDTGTSAKASHQDNINSPRAPQHKTSDTFANTPVRAASPGEGLGAQQQQKGTPITPTEPPDPGTSSAITGGGSPVHQQQQKQSPHQHQVAAPQLLDGLSKSFDQLSLKARTPAASVGTPVGLSPMLNPAAPAWTPSVHERGDIDLPDVFPPLPSAARKEQTRSSARGKQPVQPLQQPPDVGFISLPITHDVMCFPGIPEPSEDFVPKMHITAHSTKSDVQGSESGLSTAPNPDAGLISLLPTSEGKGRDEAKLPDELPHTPAAGKELTPVPSSPPQGRVSFTTAIRRKLRASDTRRTQRSLEDSEEPSSGSSSEEEDPPDPPPPPPLVSDWVHAAAPGMVIGLPASHQDVALPKMPEKEAGEPKLPTRQTRQTLRRGFL